MRSIRLHPVRMIFLLIILCGWCNLSPCSAADQQADTRVQDSKKASAPVFSFGVVADVQYGDKPTGGARHYRKSLDSLRRAVVDWNTQDLSFVIQLGDLIDGNKTPEKTHNDLNMVLREFNLLTPRLYHVVGNHCLTADREELLKKLELKRAYYSFSPKESSRWLMVVLDGNDAGYGVLGNKQLDWLRDELAKAEKDAQRVIIFNHFALLKSAAAHHRMAKPKPMLRILDKHDCVAAYFAGHDHSGGYATRNGVHHVTLHGMVEAPKKNAYAIVRVYPQRLEIEGVGKEPSRRLE